MHVPRALVYVQEGPRPLYKASPNHCHHAMEHELDMESPVSSPVFSRELTPADQDPDVTTPLYPLHLKVAWDSGINWTTLAQKIFHPEEKCLVMAEKLNAATGHVHMQGMCKLSERSLKRVREDLHNEHGLVKEYKRKKGVGFEKRPPIVSKRAKKAPDDKGFQYVCKEKNVPLYQQGFTQIELDLLHEASDKHVERLKRTCADMLDEKHKQGLILFTRAQDGIVLRNGTQEEAIKKLFDDCLFHVGEAHIEAGKDINPRYFKTQILNALVRRKEIGPNGRRILFRMF